MKREKVDKVVRGNQGNVRDYRRREAQPRMSMRRVLCLIVTPMLYLGALKDS